MELALKFNARDLKDGDVLLLAGSDLPSPDELQDLKEKLVEAGASPKMMILYSEDEDLTAVIMTQEEKERLIKALGGVLPESKK